MRGCPAPSPHRWCRRYARPCRRRIFSWATTSTPCAGSTRPARIKRSWSLPSDSEKAGSSVPAVRQDDSGAAGDHPVQCRALDWPADRLHLRRPRHLWQVQGTGAPGWPGGHSRRPEATSSRRVGGRLGRVAPGGGRLPCQAKVYEDTTVTVPELLRVPKAATMGVNRLVLLDPNVRKVFVELTEPDLEDQRSDIERLRDALTAEGFDMKADLRVLRTLPGLLRSAEFKVTAVLGGDQLIAVEAGATRDESYGVAFDLGTTTVVGTLMTLRTGMAEAVRSTLNGQAPFGADVISRISHGMQGDEAKAELRDAIQRTMNN